MNITNSSQLKSVMEEATMKALNSITAEVLDLFISEYIKKLVYDSHGVNKEYFDGTGTPTFEFLKAWDWTPLKLAINKMSTELWFNPKDMNFDPTKFLHGSIYSRPPDVRENLPSILEGKQSKLWLSVYRPEKFWQKFISDMFNAGELERIITRHFIANGFVKA